MTANVPLKSTFKFCTKLCILTTNTIYDSRVSGVLCLHQTTFPNSVKKRIEQRTSIYNALSECFSKLLAESMIQDFLKEFRSQLKKRADLEHFSWQNDLISDEKLLDSALWALHTVKGRK